MRRLLLSLLAAGPAYAADPGPALQNPAAQSLAAQSLAAGARLRQLEERMAAAWSEHDALVARRDEAGRAAAARLDVLTPLVPVLVRLQRLPPATVLFAPAPTGQTLRAYAVLRAWTGHAATEAAALAQERDEAGTRAREVATTLPRLVELVRLQQTEATALDHALQQLRTERQAQQDQAEQQAAATARLAAAEAARAPSVRAAIGAFARPGTSAPGRGVTPVAGTVVRRWGEPTDAGPATGITYRPPPGARVVTPCGGRIAFAAPFRSYGLLLIIDCGGGLHAVLAGFDRLDVVAGAVVPAGEIVGTMAAMDPFAAGGRGLLYAELRRGGMPIDPAPFFGGRL